MFLSGNDGAVTQSSRVFYNSRSFKAVCGSLYSIFCSEVAQFPVRTDTFTRSTGSTRQELPLQCSIQCSRGTRLTNTHDRRTNR